MIPAGTSPLVLALLVLLATPASGSDQMAAGGSDETLVFNSVEHDFGTVDQGDRVVAEYRFEHCGGADLVISEPIVACDCRAEIPGGREIAAGSGGLVRVECDTEAMSGDSVRTATLHVSDVKRRSIQLTLRGRVTLEAAAHPQRLYFGRVVRGTRPSKVVGLRAGKKGIRLLGVETSGAYLVAQTIKGRAEVSIRVREDAPVGVFSQDVELRTSSGRLPVVKVPVAGVVVEKAPGERWKR